MNRRPRRRLPVALVTSVALVPVAALLAACSSEGDDVQAFCDGAQGSLAGIDATGSLGDDPAAFAAAISEQRQGFDALRPPREIAADWETFTQAFADLDDALQAVDTSDQDAVNQALTEFSASADSEELSTASDNVGTFLTESCDA
jgi:hypothetical protein